MGLAATIESALGVAPTRRPAAGSGGALEASMQVAPSVQAGRDSDRMRILQQELESNPGDPALQAEMGRMQGGKSGGLADTIATALQASPAAPKPAEIPVPQAPRPAVTQIVPQEANGSTLGEKIIGAGEGALSMISGAVAAPIGAAAGLFKGLTGGKYGTKQGVEENKAMAKEVMDSLTYSPRTEVGRDVISRVGKAVDSSKLAGMGPTEGISLAAVAAGNVARLPKRAATPTGEKLPMGSVGASAAATPDRAMAMAANASPELQGVVSEMVKKKQPINLVALERQVEADSLPVRVRLSKGQATGDVAEISREQNLRGKTGNAEKFNEQNKQLIENTNAIRENAAPDVYVTSIPEHGEMLIESYLAKDAKLSADISAKYKALTDANGGGFPLDSKSFVSSADAALHKELLYDHVPPTIRKTLDRVAEDGMTFENFESLRTNLARIQRSVSADGNEKAAAGVIRDALENLPMPETAAHLKPLADSARAAAKARFDLLKADPAYKAVVTGKISADKFIDKYVIGADKKTLETLSANLADDPVAKQVIASGVVNYLKAKARVANDSGNFSQAGYNKALEGLRPKLQILFDPEQRKQIEALGNVARYTQEQPRGSYVNNSNTATAMIAEGAKGAAEGLLAAKGIPVRFIRELVQNRADKKAMNEAFQSGAGIRLKDVK